MSFSIHKPLIPGKSVSGRGGCSIVYADNKAVIFGGQFFAGDDKYTYLDETWLFDVEKLTWYKMPCSGQIPGPRYGHTAHMFGSRMFIFGGKGPNGVSYKDVYFLDLVEWIWVPVTPISPGPSPRFFHASEAVGKKMVIHGGWDGAEVFDDMWIFDSESYAWIQPKSAGFQPTARYGHSMTLTNDGRLILFGGCSISQELGTPSYNNDVRQLDTDTMIWIRPRVDGNTPTGRYGHSATLMDDGQIVIFGGWGKGGCQTSDMISDQRAKSVCLLDTKLMSWITTRKLSKKPIKHLYNHCAVRSTGSSAILMVGGYDGRQAVNDFYVLNLQPDEVV